MVLIRVKKIFILLGVFLFVILIGCTKQSIPEQEVVSVNIVDVKISDSGGKLNEEQRCSICKNGYFIAKEGDYPYEAGQRVESLTKDCSDSLDIQVNAQVSNYRYSFKCIVYQNGVNKLGNAALVAYNGLNKFTDMIREDFMKNLNIKVCCVYDGEEPKCAETNVPSRCY